MFIFYKKRLIMPAAGAQKESPEMNNIVINLWVENIEDLRRVRKNSHVCMEMAQSL